MNTMFFDKIHERTAATAYVLLLFVSGNVHTTAEKVENAALFLRLGLPSTLHVIRHENRALPKRSSNRRNLKTPALRFRVEEKKFENRLSFLKTMTSR